MIIKKNNHICYVQSPFFRWCEQTIPYLPFIFKNKRQRVKCRWFFRYHHLWKAERDMVLRLQKYYANKVDYNKIDVESLIPEYWDVKVKK